MTLEKRGERIIFLSIEGRKEVRRVPATDTLSNQDKEASALLTKGGREEDAALPRRLIDGGI